MLFRTVYGRRPLKSEETPSFRATETIHLHGFEYCELENCVMYLVRTTSKGHEIKELIQVAAIELAT